MRVLVGCEFSGIVRDAFRAKGHDAWSCDILECEKVRDYHIQGDIMNNLWGGWDLIILHPPCTALALSGNPTYASGKPGYEKRNKAIDWTTRLWLTAVSECPRVAMENPANVMGRFIGKRSQEIQPYEFGHAEQKTTWLWLRGLPALKATCMAMEEMMRLPKCRRQRVFYMSSRNPNRWKDRSRTYAGVAAAMAEQWG